MTVKHNILVVEDERDIAQLIRLHLQDLGCSVTLAHDGIVGLSEAESKPFDLIILDLMLPGLGGLDICRRLRGRAQYTPILMLTSKSSELDRVLGLELGADDYLTKPFSVMELLARVKALFRRMGEFSAGNSTNQIPGRIHIGDITLDSEQRVVTVRGRESQLTAKEFDLLSHFAQNPSRVFTREQLLNAVWGYSYAGYDHTVNSHINRLRGKIEANPDQPEYIHTIWGVGYKFYYADNNGHAQ